MSTLFTRYTIWFLLLLCGCTPPVVKTDDAIIREPIAGMYTTAGYLDITNLTPNALVLTGVTFNGGKVEIHRTSTVEGRMSMAPVTSIRIDPNQTIKFRPGGLHLMIFLYEQVLDDPHMTLLFKPMGSTELLEIPVSFDVVPIEDISHH